MLKSTLEQFRKVITNTANIERQMQAVQDVLNTQTGKVITGVSSRTEALRQALSQIHKEGITGFIDKAGRKWTPEAYVNMDIRTTVHNTAIESVKFVRKITALIFLGCRAIAAQDLYVIHIRDAIFHGTIQAVLFMTVKETT